MKNILFSTIIIYRKVFIFRKTMNLTPPQENTTREDKYVLNQVPAEYSIPLESFNAILNEILWSDRTKDSTVKFLRKMAFAKEIPENVLKILWDKSYTQSQFLERTNVMKRKETKQKEKDLHILISRARKAFPDAWLSDDEKLKKLIGVYKRTFEKHSDYDKVYYSDGSLNYVATLEQTNRVEKRQKSVSKSVEKLTQKRIEATAEMKSTLKKSDFQRLKEAVWVAMNLKNQLTKQDGLNTIEHFLKTQFNEGKMYWETAVKYFSREYFKALIEEKESLKEELYPNDRTIVEIMLKTKKEEPVCKVRWEKSIISKVIRVLNKSGVFLDKIPESEEARSQIQEKIQKWIDSYYEVLKEYEIKSYNQNGKISWNKLDLEDMGNLYKVENREVIAYSDEDIQQLLIANLQKRKVPSEDIENNIFCWFESFVKELICFKSTMRKKSLTKIEVFRKLGFVYLSSDESVKWNGQLGTTIRKKIKTQPVEAKKIMD